MSQFMICHSIGDLLHYNCIRIECLQQNHGYILEHAQLWYHEDEIKNVHCVVDIDHLLSEAQYIFEGDMSVIEKTAVYSLLDILYERCDSIYMWYSDQEDEIIQVYSKKEYFEEIKKALESSMLNCNLSMMRQKDVKVD